MKTKLTINDIKIMLDNKMNVDAIGGYKDSIVRGIIFPYKIEKRRVILYKLEELGYEYEHDASVFGYEHCFIFEIEPTTYDKIADLRNKYNIEELDLGGFKNDK